jgi:uncharacterized membrane protein
MLQPGGMIKGLSGRVGAIDNHSIISAVPPPCRYVYIFGDLWCHQRSDRSLFINGNQMPVCARCLGIFLGIPFGILASTLTWIGDVDERLHKKVLVLISIGYAPILIDSIGQSVGSWDSTNTIRLLTGTTAGIVFGIILTILINVIEKAVIHR